MLPAAERPHPVGGIDYPRTLQECDSWFSCETACVDFLRRVRWPDGFKCPGCGEGAAWSTGRGLLRCKACQLQTSVTAGTILDGTRKPIRVWLQTMWYVTTQKHGMSALGLQRVLGFGSYQTAWAWLHKLRRAMVRPGRDRLSGEVEVDETYVGGAEAGVSGRETEKKAVVVIAAEVRGKAIGRVRISSVPDASGESLLPFIQGAVSEGSTIRTDGWPGYGGLKELRYRHRTKVLSRTVDPAHVVMPRVHRVASLLHRWWLGTHQGAISLQHLDYYLDEFTFRFNRRTSAARGLLFFRLLQQALLVDPVPYKSLVGGTDGTATTRSCG